MSTELIGLHFHLHEENFIFQKLRSLSCVAIFVVQQFTFAVSTVSTNSVH